MGDLRTPALPAAPQLNTGLLVFLETMTVVAQARAENARMDWLHDAAQKVWRGIQDQQEGIPEFDGDDWNDPASAAAARLLGLEMIYMGYRHRELLSDETRAIVEEYADIFPQIDIADPLSDDAEKTLEIGKGSIEKLIKKLPKWLQRAMEVLMEAIKIARLSA